MPDTLTLLNTLDIQFNQAKPLFQVKQANSQSIGNSSVTTLSYDTLIFDSHSGWNSGTHVYTVQVAGWYWASILVNWQTNTSGIRTCRLNRNGTGSSVVIGTCTPGTGTSAIGTYITGPVQCSIGDTLKVEVVQTSGGSLSTQVTAGYTSVFTLDWMKR